VPFTKKETAGIGAWKLTYPGTATRIKLQNNSSELRTGQFMLKYAEKQAECFVSLLEKEV
jgi:hypothetical protein